MAGQGKNVDLAVMLLLERAYEQPSSQRESFIDGQEDVPHKVRQRATALLQEDKASQTSQASLQTGGARIDDEDEAMPERIGAYRVLRLIGRGGMGNVYLAERTTGDFDQIVAIKLIKPGLLSDSVIERFRRERQLLARLRHKNIAHLYDGGECDDGAPFIIMEYVDGMALSKWVEQQQPDIKARLKLFEQVCDAVAHAYQNLIIHRDLTPSNVLVTDMGEAKLIDFGIAKPQTEEGEEAAPSTFTGLSLTPGYAAPERSKGVDANTLSDVYSLGKILEMLLGEDSNPETHSIVDKAISADPDKRYKTIGALTADLRRWKNGEAIPTYSSAASYRLKKFVRRHKVGTAATLAGAAIFTGAFIITLVQYQNAQARYAETRAMANTMMFEVFDEISKVPGSASARAVLAKTAQKYLDSLASGPFADADTRLEAGRGYFRLARALGGTRGQSLGQHTVAKNNYAKSRALLEGLHSDYPERDDVKGALGLTLAYVAGETLHMDGNIEASRSLAIKSQHLLSKIQAHDADSASALGRAHNFEGDSYIWDGEYEAARVRLHKGIDTLESMTPKVRNSLEVRRALSALWISEGISFGSESKFQEALVPLKKSISLQRRIAVDSSNIPSDIEYLTLSLFHLANAQSRMGRHSDALEIAEEAIQLSSESNRRDPQDIGPIEVLANLTVLKAKIQAKLRRFDEASALANEAVVYSRQLNEISGDVAKGADDAGSPTLRCCPGASYG